MSEALGTVIAAEESPSTSEFSFVVKGGGVRKGQYVQSSTARACCSVSFQKFSSRTDISSARKASRITRRGRG